MPYSDSIHALIVRTGTYLGKFEAKDGWTESEILRALIKLVWLCKDKNEVSDLIRRATEGFPVVAIDVFAAHNKLIDRGRDVPGSFILQHLQFVYASC